VVYASQTTNFTERDQANCQPGCADKSSSGTDVDCRLGSQSFAKEAKIRGIHDGAWALRAGRLRQRFDNQEKACADPSESAVWKADYRPERSKDGLRKDYC
jgi:hypothetical protein